MNKLDSLQIGECGELLLAYKLLMNGIESMRPTIDKGIDLIAIKGKKAMPIQVKTTEKFRPAGGKGKDSFRWGVSKKCCADYFAFVFLQEEKIWLMSKNDLKKMAQQETSSGWNFFMHKDKKKGRKDGKKDVMEDFDDFLIDNSIKKLFK